MGAYLEELDKRIKLLKNSYREQNDFRAARREIEKHGGKWAAENGTTYQIIDGAIYASVTEDGVTQVLVMGGDAPIPFVAELTYDLQAAKPEDRIRLAEELNREISKKASVAPQTRIVVIVEKDWLSRISLKRWGTVHWRLHLKPTRLTLEARKRHHRVFDPDLIYPGDTFEVIH